METSCFCLKQVRMDDVRGYLVVSALEKCGSWGHDPVGEWRMTLAWWSRCCTLTGYLAKKVMNVTSTTDVNKIRNKQKKGKISMFQPYLCGWRCPPSPWRTWSGQCRAWNREPDPPGQVTGLWSLRGTSPACHGSAPGPPPSGRAAPSAHCCCWPWSRVSPQLARNHQRADEEKEIVISNREL